MIAPPSPHFQRDMLGAALEWLSQGQTRYRSAAVEGTIVLVLGGTGPEVTLGSIQTHIEDPRKELPKPRAPWPQGRFEMKFQGYSKPRAMAILTHGNTLDGWDTLWFLDLFSRIRYDFDKQARRQQGYLDKPVETMNVVRPTQRFRFRFFPNKSHPATNRDISLALFKLIQSFLFYGARQLDFTLRDERRETLGVGYCDCLSTSPTIAVSEDVNSTNAITYSDFDGFNGTTTDGPEVSISALLSEAGLSTHNSSSLNVTAA
ncbi:MAG: hypothetical protein Q9223_004244 [Gallowayella weberi]